MVLLRRLLSLDPIGSHGSPRWVLLQAGGDSCGAKFAAVHITKCAACSGNGKIMRKGIEGTWNECPISVFEVHARERDGWLDCGSDVGLVGSSGAPADLDDGGVVPPDPCKCLCCALRGELECCLDCDDAEAVCV